MKLYLLMNQKKQQKNNMENNMENIDIAISFDDTGSMSSVRKQVKAQIKNLIGRLTTDIKGIRFAIIIMNDYCDAPAHMLVQDFTDNINKIEKFIDRNSPQGGGDAPECYELALNVTRGLDWKSDRKILIMIGDEIPHTIGYSIMGIDKKKYTCVHDWKKEAKELGDMGVSIYGVQALGRRASNYFYDNISSITGGTKLDLSQFQDIVTYINAIVYKQTGQLDDYQSSDPTFTKNLAIKAMFSKLKGLTSTLSADTLSAEKIELLSKFQVMKVNTLTPIKEFTESNGCTYKKGKGYYQLVERTGDGKANREIIQADKEVIFVDKITGEVNDNTTWCREQLGVPFGTKGKVSPLSIPDIMNKYKIFVQSNSFTRKLDAGCEFLYELESK